MLSIARGRRAEAHGIVAAIVAAPLLEFELTSRSARSCGGSSREVRRGAQFLRHVDHQRPSQARLPSIHGRTHGGRFALPLHLGVTAPARLLRRAPGRTNADLSTTTTIARAAAAAPEEADVVHLRRVRAGRCRARPLGRCRRRRRTCCTTSSGRASSRACRCSSACSRSAPSGARSTAPRGSRTRRRRRRSPRRPRRSARRTRARARSTRRTSSAWRAPPPPTPRATMRRPKCLACASGSRRRWRRCTRRPACA